MAFDDRQRRMVYDRTDGYCHICHKKLAFANYGTAGARGAWEVDHSRPRARGGSNHGNNLFAACVGCNRSKGAMTTQTARRRNFTIRAPMSSTRKRALRQENTALGTLLGAGVAAAVAGPAGVLAMGAAALAGGLVGRQIGKAIRIPKA